MVFKGHFELRVNTELSPNCRIRQLGENFPVTPGGSIDMQTVVTAGFMAVSGISINTVKKMFLSEANLGNSTLYDNIQTLGRFCLPLCEYISDRVDQATTALFDESDL